MRVVLGGPNKAANKLAGSIRSNGTVRLSSQDRAQLTQSRRDAVLTYLQQNFHAKDNAGDFRSCSREFIDSQISRLKSCKFPFNKSVTVLAERYVKRLRKAPVNMVLVRLHQDQDL